MEANFKRINSIRNRSYLITKICCT